MVELLGAKPSFYCSRLGCECKQQVLAREMLKPAIEAQERHRQYRDDASSSRGHDKQPVSALS